MLDTVLPYTSVYFSVVFPVYKTYLDDRDDLLFQLLMDTFDRKYVKYGFITFVIVYF